MTPSLVMCLGKTGDLCTILPILLKEATASGLQVPLMMSKDYASVLDGVSYVRPVVFNGGAHEIDVAFLEAAKTSPDVRVAQVCGPPALLRRHVLDRHPQIKDGQFRGDSFEKSLWDLLNHWADFPNGWPLIFDKRSHEREKALLDSLEAQPRKNREKLILVSTGRQPGIKPDDGHFRQKALLMLVLGLAFKRGYRIIDLDSVVAERFFDLLGLYEQAHCLVATDNAPLHLAYACRNLPVCALISDKPALWAGSAWRPNHIFHCRYGDFADRVHEMIAAITDLGSAHDRFWQQKVQGSKLIHVWSQYEVNDENRERHLIASRNWRDRYHRDQNWVECRMEQGAFGRDTTTVKLDGGRYPFVKDVLRAAAQRAKTGDTIVLTRCDSCFGEVPIREGWAQRLMRNKDGDSVAPWIDLIAFPRRTIDRIGELPDLVMGPDPYWSSVVKEWAGGSEIEDAVWRNEK